MTDRRLLIGRCLLALSLFLGFPVATFAFEIPPIDGFVTDAANRLNAAQKQDLEEKLVEYWRSTSNEIAIVTVSTLNGEPIEEVALAIARKLAIGQKTKDNGILILISFDNNMIRMEVGYGLEGAVPDIVAKGIIDTDLIPAFRQGDYYGGMLAAFDSLSKHIGGEYTADRYTTQDSGGGSITYFIFFGLIVLQWLLAVMARSKSWWLGGVFGGIGGLVLALIFGWWLSIPALIVIGLLLDFAVSKGYRKRGNSAWWAGGGWGGGGGFGGRGGGGFGGFGGGGFGGGGASGRW